MAESSAARSSSFKLLSWNIDGLDARDLEERTTAVYQTILLKQPDFVFLQEVIRASVAILEKKLKSRYHLFAPTDPPQHYYVMILVKRDADLRVGVFESKTFPGSVMGRQLVQLPVSCRGLDILLMTSHLESMRDYSGERKNQLRTAFGVMTETQRENVCIFGGDLNVREAEVKSVKVPKNTIDVWEACGADHNSMYTWDVSANDNLNWTYPNKPKTRYDRIYLAPSDGKLRPTKFELVGQDRLHECGRFPSDHWGLWAEFAQL